MKKISFLGFFICISLISFSQSAIANKDITSTDEETSTTINVVKNDNSINISSLKIVTNPLNGTATTNNDGTISYTPNNNFFGKDSLIYEICGNNGTCDTAYSIITVYNTIDDVIANKDITSTKKETTINVNVITNDIDVDTGFDLTKLSTLTNPLNGVATADNNGTISYTPNNNFFGKDSLIYEICGNNGTCDIAYFVIDVQNDVISNLISFDKKENIIYPNPFTTSINISNEFVTNGNIEIYDITGQLIMSQNINNKKIMLDVNQGIYIIYVKDVNNNILHIEKIIKQ